MTDAELLEEERKKREEERKKREAAATTMATPDSIAGLSINGTPLTPEAITNPQLQFPSAQTAQEVQPQAPVMDMSQENPDFGAMLRSSGIPDFNVVAQIPGIENVRNPGVFDPTKIEPVEPVGTPTTVGESISQTYKESVLADLINKGFGQEVFQSKSLDGTPTYSIYNKRFGTLGSQVPYSEASPEAKAQAMKFMLSTGGQERPLPATPTSPVLNAEQVQGVLNEQRAATGASASEATPSVTPTIETPSGDAQGQAGATIPQGEVGSPQAFFANIRNQRELTPEEIARGEAKAAEMGTTFDPNVGFSRKAFEDFQAAQAGATAPAGGLTTVGGAPLSEFLSGQAMPERGFTQPERPMAGRGVTLTPEQMDDLSAARQARVAVRDRLPGETQTQRDTRIAQSRTTGGQTEGLSFDEARRRAEGELAARGARNPTASQVNALAKSIQAAEPERLAKLEAQRVKDAKTPEQIESDRLAIEAQKLQNERTRQIIAKGKEPDATTAEKKAASRAQAVQDGTITQAQADDANKRDLLGSPPAGYDTWAQAEAAQGQDLDGDGKVSTEAEASQATPTEFTPRQESGIKKVMSDNGITRDEAIKALTKAGKLK
jgi:hypothetical protein